MKTKGGVFLKFIFLDIDDVLVTSRHLSKNGLNREDFDPVSVENLNEILRITEASIVISSNWRHGYSLNELKYVFNKNNVIDIIIDVTPFFNHTTMRGEEINSYLNMNNILPDDILILDDEENMLNLSYLYIQVNF